VAALDIKLKQTEQKNAELTAHLRSASASTRRWVNQLEGERRKLQEQSERLQRELQQLQEQNRHIAKADRRRC